jgi:hydrogenase maturation protease
MTGSLLADIPVALAMPLAIRSPRILVIGYGNPGRQDDGLGPAAAAEIEKIGWPNVTTSDNYQLVIEDAIQIAAHDIVWFVDAARQGDARCAVHRLSPALDFTFTSHLLKPQALLAIAGQQFGKSPDAHLVSIRGYEFDFLEGLSDRGRDNLALAVALLRRRIGYLSKVSR